MDDTMTLVRKQKKKKTRWATLPQRACTISRTYARKRAGKWLSAVM